MRRIIASWIDYMICMFPYFTLANVRGLGIAGEDIRIIRLVVYIALLGYLFITDYWLGGLTLGKWILGIRPEWHWEEGKARLVNSLLHTFLKFLLFVIWPVTLILYFCLDRQMPYDKRLGIIDTQRGYIVRQDVDKSCDQCGGVVRSGTFIIFCDARPYIKGTVLYCK